MQQSPALSDRYSILDALGGGGGGKVYKVEDRFRQEILTLKLYDPSEADSTDEESFRAEFLLCSTIRHPNLIAAFDYGHDSGNRPFFTMEYARGLPVSSDICSGGSDAFLKTLDQICSGLQLLHTFGYLHSDLKPDNIIIDRSEDSPVVKILDFGLVKSFDAERPREISGTVEYMAPEIFSTGVPTVQSDIYSLGIVLFEIITGKPPFVNKDPLEIISNHIERELPHIESVPSFVNESCMNIISRMLAKNPADRPRSVTDIRESFSTALNGRAGATIESEIGAYVDTALRRTVSQIPQLRNLPPHGIHLTATDPELAAHSYDIVRASMQTDFMNVREQTSDISLTSVHSERFRDLDLLRDDEISEERRERDYVALTGQYGRVSESASKSKLIDNEAVLQTALEPLFKSTNESIEILDNLLSSLSGSTRLAKSLLQRLCRSGAIKVADNKWSLSVEDTGNLELTQDELRILEDSLSEAEISKHNELRRLSVYDHPFTEGAIAHLLSIDHESARATARELTADRVLIESDAAVEFRHEQLRRALYSGLSAEEKRTLHAAAAQYLLANPSEKDDHIHLKVGRHYLMSNKPREAIHHAVEYQKEMARQGEYVRPERLLSQCETAISHNGVVDDGLIAQLLMALGDSLKQQGRFDEATQKYRKIIELESVNPVLRAETYKDLGDIYKSRVDFSKGIEVLEKAIEIYKSLDDRLEISHTLNNMGNMFWIDSRYKDALQKYNEALSIQEDLGVVKDIASTLTNIGSTSFALGDYEKAIDQYKRSIELKKTINDQPEIARTYNNLAVVYLKMQQSGRALNYLNRSMAINKSIGAQKELLINLENTAEVCLGLGEFRRAEELAAEGLASARRLEDPPHVGVFSYILGILYGERGLYGKSLEFLSEAEQIGNTISDRSFATKTSLAQAECLLTLNCRHLAKERLESAQSLISPIEPSPELTRLKVASARLAAAGGTDDGEVLAHLDAIDSIALEHKYEEELCKSLLTRLDIGLRCERIPANALEKLDDLTEIDQHTVYRSHLYFYLGVASYFEKSYNEALSYLEQAAVMATAFEQRELLWKIEFYRGRIHIEQLEYEDAFHVLQQAGIIMKDIVADIGNNELSRYYMEAPDKKALMEAVRHLAVKLA
jgi:serine/threonine protein kinase/tetratricopeptide (TPR) repeat protein